MTEKVDKGSCFNFWKLSYRRKLIRLVWTTPFISLLFLFPKDLELRGIDRDIWIICAFSASAIQMLYTFYMWLKNER